MRTRSSLRRFTRFALLCSSTALISLSYLDASHGAEILVDGATTAQNGGNTFNSGDTLTVTQSGSIATMGAHGIDDNGTSGGPFVVNVLGDVTVTNSVGSGFDGVDLDSPSTITVSGSINVNGNEGNGLDVNDGSSITLNSGANITTSGTEGIGIEVDENNTITINDGAKIQTSGYEGHAIQTDDNNTIVVDGDIVTNGTRSVGVFLRDDSTVTVSGNVKTTGYQSDAIVMREDNKVSVSGTVHTTGDDSYGFYVFGENQVTVSGKIVSDKAGSFLVLGSGSTLNLNAPAFLAGAFDFQDRVTVNINTGPSHSVFWQFRNDNPGGDFPTGFLVGTAPTVTGPVPGFWNGTDQTFATYDPTRFAASFEQLADMSRQLTQGLPGFGGSGVSDAPVAFSSSHGKDAALDQSGHVPIWLKMSGGFWQHGGNEATLDRDSNMIAVSAGATVLEVERLKIGATTGALHRELTADSRFVRSYDNEAWSVFGGLYGEAQFGAGSFANFATLGGWMSHNDDRFVNDNLSTSGGINNGSIHAKSDYDSWWVSPTLRVGHHFDVGNGLRVTPSVTARYASQWIEAFEETGSNANAALASSHIAIGEAAFDVSIEKAFEASTLGAQFGVLHRQRLGGDNSVNVLLNGLEQAVPMFEDNQTSVYLGLSAKATLASHTELSFDVHADIGNNDIGYQGHIALSHNF